MSTYTLAGKGRRSLPVIAMALAAVFYLLDALRLVIVSVINLVGGTPFRYVVSNFLSAGTLLLWVAVAASFLFSFLFAKAKWLQFAGAAVAILTSFISMISGIVNGFRYVSVFAGLWNCVVAIFGFLMIAVLIGSFLLSGKNLWILRIVSVVYLLITGIGDISGLFTSIAQVIEVATHGYGVGFVYYLNVIVALLFSASGFWFALAFVLYAWLGFRKEQAPVEVVVSDAAAVEDESLPAEPVAEE